MDFDLSPDELVFRQEVRDFIKTNMPDKVAKKDEMAFVTEWNKKVREKRWVGYTWPKEMGGGGGSLMKQVILKQEMAIAKTPGLGTCFMGLSWVGPGIIQYGTKDQQERFLPDILDSKFQWCTGYSEPNIGSDLASLQCKAENKGDHYLVNGQKMWTSLAPFAEWMILLVRTDSSSENKHEGITCLLVHMKSPGLEVRPIKNMTGSAVFAEVFFTDVKVPQENRLGEEGKGWMVTVSALANERSSIAEVAGLERKLEDLKALVKRIEIQGKPATQDQSVRRTVAGFETIIESMRLNGMRYLTKQLKGEPVSSETSVNKLHKATLEVEMGDYAVSLMGHVGIHSRNSPDALDKGRYAYRALSWPDVVIGGGTPNIQKNIISERILGLPKD
ncbi:MAG: acyl-CoA dehydrogenase family protein [Pseudomonadales bacterium]|nr:acyl-CoA dehydrogenase family protein [Pseudomonadales bacterium]